MSHDARLIVADTAELNIKAWESPEIIDLLIRMRQDAASSSVSAKEASKVNLSLLLIHEGRWEESIQLLAPKGSLPDDLEDLFNLLMAKWGLSDYVDRTLAERLHDRMQESSRFQDPNYFQCRAVVEWAIGLLAESSDYLNRAIAGYEALAGPIFSCWRYARVTPEQFKEDCAAIRSLVNGEPLLPEFIIRNKAARSAAE